MGGSRSERSTQGSVVRVRRARVRRGGVWAVAALLLLPVAASANAPFERVDALVLVDVDSLWSAVTDGTHAYFGTDTMPGQVVKVNLATMTQVAALDLLEAEDENYLYPAVLDQDRTHAYFGTCQADGSGDIKASVVKIRLSDMTRVGALKMAEDEGCLWLAVSDGTHGYFVDYYEQRLIKVNLASMTRVDDFDIGLFTASMVSDGTHAYIASDGALAQVVKVNLATMTAVGSPLTLAAGMDFTYGAVRVGNHAYFASCTGDAELLQKVDLTNMALVGDPLELGEGVSCPWAAVTDGTFAYFGTADSPARVVKVDLAAMELVGSIVLEDDEEEYVEQYLYGGVLVGSFAYFGAYSGQVVRVRLGDDAAPVSPVSRIAVACTPDVLAVGTSVTCTVTGGDPGIDILWQAAYNPVFAGQGVTLDADGTGTFSFTVPRAAAGQVVTVELVEWLAPVSLGVVGGPVPTSVPSGGGPVPVWSLVLVALAVGVLVRRTATVGRPS
jgi:hypothetical protein